MEERDTEKQLTDEERRDKKKKKVVKKRKTIKKKIVTGEDGKPVVTEEITEEDLPEDFEVTITDEKESVIEGVVKPVITEIREDATTHAEIVVEEIIHKEEGPMEERDTEKQLNDDERRDKKKKKVSKKRKTIKKKIVTGEDGKPVVTEEITEEDLPEDFEVTITDEKESVIEGVVKPVITEIGDDATIHAEIVVEEMVDKEEGPMEDRKKKKIIKK